MLTELRETRGEVQGEFCSTVTATQDTSDSAYKPLETVLPR